MRRWGRAPEDRDAEQALGLLTESLASGRPGLRVALLPLEGVCVRRRTRRPPRWRRLEYEGKGPCGNLRGGTVGRWDDRSPCVSACSVCASKREGWRAGGTARVPDGCVVRGWVRRRVC